MADKRPGTAERAYHRLKLFEKPLDVFYFLEKSPHPAEITGTTSSAKMKNTGLN
jgi:hypothetical protein